MDKQLKKGIVLEDTEANVSVLSENTNYSLNLYNTIYALYKIPEALQKAYTLYQSINLQPLLSAISSVDYEKKLSTAYEAISKIQTYDWSKVTMPTIPTYDWSKIIVQIPQPDSTEDS